MADKKLHKVNKNRMLTGVCSGYAEFFHIDVTIVRLIFIVLACIKGLGILAYIVSVILLPADLEFSFDSDKESIESEGEGTSTASSSSKVPHTDEEFDSYFKNN